MQRAKCFELLQRFSKKYEPMSDSNSTRTMAVQWTTDKAGEEPTAQPLRQQDYRIFVPQRIDFGPASRDETKIASRGEVVGLKNVAASSLDVIANGRGFTTLLEVKAPRAHLQKQQSTTAFTLLSKFDGVILRRNGRR